MGENMDGNTQEKYDQYDLAEEHHVLKEWDYLLQCLFNVPAMLSQVLSVSPRLWFEKHISCITKERARIWWNNSQKKSFITGSQVIDLYYQQICYGMLELDAGYLVSKLVPGLPQHFAQQCALLLHNIEYEIYKQFQHRKLLPLLVEDARKLLTKREKDVLEGLIRGESEREMAQRLGLAESTIHSHLQRLYSSLHVHSAEEAIMRSFELRIVEWLDVSLGESD
jgi:DNA-binding CsgD family transcriptional regulator